MVDRQREERKAELRQSRLREEAAARASERRQRMLKLGAAAVFGAIVIVAAFILISESGSDSGGGNASDIRDAGLVSGLLKGIPQNGLELGDPKAKAVVVEFGDLQCPICKEYSETVIPKLISGPVRQGKARIEFRNYLVIGPQSADAGAAAIAAGRAGSRLELHRALLSQPGCRGLRLRRRRLPGVDRPGRRGARHCRVEQRPAQILAAQAGDDEDQQAGGLASASTARPRSW